MVRVSGVHQASSQQFARSRTRTDNLCEGADAQDTILLQSNHTIYDLPPGIVVEMFSDEYCEGPRLSIYTHLSFFFRAHTLREY